MTVACIARVYLASPSISRYIVGDSTLPEPHACIQRAASVAVAAIDPAPPAAVTTERNGMTSGGPRPA